MKSIKIGALSLAGIIFVSSCASSYQAQSGVTGAVIGGRVGETIGFLSGRGHHRGHNAALGSLIGMGVGAVLGVGIASQTEKNESQRYDTRSQGDYNSTSDYGNQPAYQTNGGTDAATISSGDISISNLTYMDANSDGYLAKGEVCEVEGYITNTTDETLNDIVIYLMSDNERDYYISPALTTTLQPGQRIRYRGRIICKKTKKRPAAQVTLCAQHQGTTTRSNYLSIKTKGRY